MPLTHVFPHLAPAMEESASPAVATPAPAQETETETETTTVPGTTGPAPIPAVAEQPPVPVTEKPKPKMAGNGAGWAPFVTPSTSPRVDFSESYDVSTLKDRSALVTGGAHGIGRGCVEGLAEAGCYVTFLDVQEDIGRAAEKEMREKGLNVQFIQTDVTSWEAIVAAFKAAVEFSPGKTVDIVIPNAGVAAPSLYFWLSNTPLNENKDPMPPPTRTVNVNYMAVYTTVHAAMYYFKNFPGPDLKSKLIIFVASMGGYNPMPSVIDYNSTKWGVRGMFWSLRNIGAFLGPGKPEFRVNLIAPTWVRTNMTKGIQARIQESDSAVKVAEVSDVVDVVLRMAADESVKGRAAAIAAERKSFDLCDDSEGLGVGKILSDPEYLKLFGYGPSAPQPKKEEQSVPKDAAENGVNGSTVQPTDTGIAVA